MSRPRVALGGLPDLVPGRLAARVALALVPYSPMLPCSYFDSCLPCSRCHVPRDTFPGGEQTAAGPGCQHAA